jgi:hypothetical protein
MTTRYIALEIDPIRKTVLVKEAGYRSEDVFPRYPIEADKQVFRVMVKDSESAYFPAPGEDLRPIVGGINDLFGKLVFVTMDDDHLLAERNRVIQNSYEARALAQDFGRPLEGPTVIIQGAAANQTDDSLMSVIVDRALGAFHAVQAGETAGAIFEDLPETRRHLEVVVDHLANLVAIRRRSNPQTPDVVVGLTA